MEEKLITYDTAKLAKEHGFDWKHTDFYIDKAKNGDYTDLPCVPQSFLQKWLRDKHNIYVTITQDFYTTGINFLCQVLIYDPTDDYNCTHKLSSGLYGDNHEFPTYEDALEFGLKLGFNKLDEICKNN